MIKRYKPYIITFYILAAISLIVAAFYDLQIDISLNNPDNIFAQWLRNTGEMPSRLICPLAGAVLYYTCSKKSEKIIALLIELGGSAYLGYHIGDYFFTENQIIFGIVYGIGIGLIILFAGKYIRLTKKQAAFLKTLAIYGIAIMAIELLTVEGLKYLWGRVRFRDLLAAGSYDEFTPWYQINGINGNKSFPSGHTGGAAMSYLLMFMPYMSKEKNVGKNCAICFFIPLVYTSAVAYTRLVMGAHYLSDVTVGGIISFTIVIIAMAIFDKRSAKKLNLSQH